MVFDDTSLGWHHPRDDIHYDLLMVNVTDVATTQVSGHQDQSMKHHAIRGWCRAGADHRPSFDDTNLPRLAPPFVTASRHDLVMLDVTDIASAQVSGHQGTNLGWGHTGDDQPPSLG